MWLLAIKSLLADRGKLLTSVLGVAFAVCLVNVQAGLLLGLIKKASMLVDHGQADIWIGHKHMNNVDIGTFIPERWVQRIRAVEGVERADPYLILFGQMTMPDGRFENVIVVGCQESSLLGNAWTMEQGDPRAIRQPDSILVDVCDNERLGNLKVGDVREINGRRARVAGLTRGIVGFTTNPYVFTTLEQARGRYGAGVNVPPDHCSYFLVKARPGTDVGELCTRLRQRLPELEVYEKEQYARRCMEYWLTRTGIGISFGLAALLGLLVGLAVVAQTLYASVTERLKEFAALKAMGAGDRSIGRFLVVQAVGIATLGGVVGLLAACSLGQVLDSPRAPVMLTGWVAASSVLLVTGMCLVAAWLPYLRIRRLDPASVLRS
jgi:putative ABC transport system permease protein